MYWNSEADIGHVFRAVKKNDGNYLIMEIKGGGFEVLNIELTEEDIEENIQNEAWILLKQ